MDGPPEKLLAVLVRETTKDIWHGFESGCFSKGDSCSGPLAVVHHDGVMSPLEILRGKKSLTDP